MDHPLYLEIKIVLGIDGEVEGGFCCRIEGKGGKADPESRDPADPNGSRWIVLDPNKCF